MDRLWAGWRLAYVEDTAPPVPPGEGSIFQRILASGEPDERTYVVWRGDWCFAILNAFPYTNGHVMVMPYRAVGDLEALTAEESTELWSGVQDAVVALKAAYRPGGVNVGINLGAAAGAGVPDHLHVHCLPRWGGDTNFMTTVAEARVMPEALQDSWRRLKDAWPT